MSVRLSLDEEDAVALFSFLGRVLEDQNGALLRPAITHDGELWALNNMLQSLEASLNQPFDADYRAVVARSLQKLTRKYGDWPT